VEKEQFLHGHKSKSNLFGHDFAPPDQRHLLRSMRNVSQTKGGLIKSMVNSGIKVTNVWSIWGKR